MVAKTFDDALKAMWPAHLLGLCRWLGVPVEFEPVRLAESMPSAGTRAVDLLLRVGERLVLHVEFQTRPRRRFPWRMLDYRVRLAAMADLEGVTIVQHAVLLGPGRLRDRIRVPVFPSGITFTTCRTRIPSSSSSIRRWRRSPRWPAKPTATGPPRSCGRSMSSPGPIPASVTSWPGRR